MRLLLVLALALPLSAQELFPRFSVTGGSYQTTSSTDVRVDPEQHGGTGIGTAINIERDLGLESERNVQRFTVAWRPFRRHELAGSFFSTSRSGFREIDQEIVFRDRVYPVRAQVSTNVDLDYWDATYTFWARRSERDGFGIVIGAAGLSLDARLLATTPGQSLTISEEAQTDVPVALIGAQGRVALTSKLFLEGSAATLPEVEIDVYKGSAITAAARLEYRFIRNFGVGAAYNYFKLDGTVTDPQLSGDLGLKVSGVEGYVRLAF